MGKIKRINPFFFNCAEALGYRDYIRYDASIIRGLDYYTGTVIEALETAGEVHRSILGGGRYDNLLADVGGEPVPGVGFAMGDMVITLILESLNRIPVEVKQRKNLILVTNFDESYLLKSYSLAAELRSAGIDVITYPTIDKLNRQFKYADRIGARIAVIIGPDELSSGMVTLKNLTSHEQQTVPLASITNAILEMLASSESL